ncbi:MAG: PD40 domain-containing protein [Candidatus Eisenbacteria bacterium]|nr:PD40 domain-containing protein [Candidatus Eisenbacteria bacterium]
MRAARRVKFARVALALAALLAGLAVSVAPQSAVPSAPATPAAPATPPSFRQDVAWSPDGQTIAWSEYSIVEPDSSPSWSIWSSTPAGTRRVRLVPNAQWVDFSPDGRRLVYGAQVDGNWDVYSARRDGSDARRLTRDPAVDREPAWSPRGDRIAFTSNRDGAQELFVMNADGSNPRRLTNDSTDSHNPAWSADGTKLVWYARDAGGDRLHVASADGSNAAVVPTTDAGAIHPCFLPDGRLLFAGLTPAGRRLLTTIATDGSNQVVLGGIEAFYARPSRDGRRIAFLAGAWPRSRICVARADGSAARIVIGDPREQR